MPWLIAWVWSIADMIWLGFLVLWIHWFFAPAFVRIDQIRMFGMTHRHSSRVRIHLRQIGNLLRRLGRCSSRSIPGSLVGKQFGSLTRRLFGILGTLLGSSRMSGMTRRRSSMVRIHLRLLGILRHRLGMFGSFDKLLRILFDSLLRSLSGNLPRNQSDTRLRNQIDMKPHTPSGS